MVGAYIPPHFQINLSLNRVHFCNETNTCAHGGVHAADSTRWVNSPPVTLDDPETVWRFWPTWINSPRATPSCGSGPLGLTSLVPFYVPQNPVAILALIQEFQVSFGFCGTQNGTRLVNPSGEPLLGVARGELTQVGQNLLRVSGSSRVAGGELTHRILSAACDRPPCAHGCVSLQGWTRLIDKLIWKRGGM